MIKKILLILSAITTITFLSFSIANGLNKYKLSNLDNCKSSYSYSGNSHAYFYGYTKDTLYSDMIYPNITSRYICIDGLIRAIAHDEYNTYALYEKRSASKGYCVVQMNMQNGECNYFDIGTQKTISHSSFAFSNNEIFIIQTDSYFAYVSSYNSNGGKMFNYKFQNNVESLFINDSKAYALLDNGDIYLLSNGVQTYYSNIGSNHDFQNAGVGYVFTNGNLLISLNSDARENITGSGAGFVTKSDGKIFCLKGNHLYCDNKNLVKTNDAKLMAVCKNNIAVVDNAFDCTIYYADDFENYDSNFGQKNENIAPDYSQNYKIDGNVIYGFECGTKVKSLSDTLTFYDTNNNRISSGNLKTGYRCQFSGNNYSVAVRGDITGEGNLKSNDISALMKHFTKNNTLNGEYLKAADFNLDGNVDNRDLVLMARKYEDSK